MSGISALASNIIGKTCIRLQETVAALERKNVELSITITEQGQTIANQKEENNR